MHAHPFFVMLSRAFEAVYREIIFGVCILTSSNKRIIKRLHEAVEAFAAQDGSVLAVDLRQATDKEG